jgi:hypothetical protein
MQDWYHSLPTDSAHRSHVKSAHTLARILLETAEHAA